VLSQEEEKQRRRAEEEHINKIREEDKQISAKKKEIENRESRWTGMRNIAQKIREILEEVKANHPLISKARFSEISTQENEKYSSIIMEGRYQTGSVKYKGREYYNSHSFQQIIISFEWGNKLRLTDTEQRYIEENRYLPENINMWERLKLESKIRSAPEKILENEKTGFNLAIRKNVFDSKDIYEEIFLLINTRYICDVKDFVNNPNVIYPQLILAIEHVKDWTRPNWLKKGVDYFATKTYEGVSEGGG
jgi:hypothetical protein